MSKHTPGPWEVSCSVQVVGASPGNRCIVAQPFTDGTQGPVIAMEAQIANANLIAAAPDLLEALEELMKHYPYKTSIIASNALFAIAKARGQS